MKIALGERGSTQKCIQYWFDRCLPYALLLPLFCIDCFQFFTWTYYYIPTVLLYYYSIILVRNSYSLLVCTLLCIGIASIYTHDFFGMQLIPIIPTTIGGTIMNRFIYRRNITLYVNSVLGMLCSVYMQTYWLGLSNYIAISCTQICISIGITWFITKHLLHGDTTP